MYTYLKTRLITHNNYYIMKPTTPFENVLVHIGNELYQQRHLKKQKITSVSSDIGISHAVLSRIENGRYKSLTIALLHKLANYYEVPMGTLLLMQDDEVANEIVEYLKSEVTFLREHYKLILESKRH